MANEQNLEERAKRNPDETVEVIITCRSITPDVEAQLKQAGFTATGREQIAHGLIYGKLRLRDLGSVKRIPGIDSVTLDSEQHIF